MPDQHDLSVGDQFQGGEHHPPLYGRSITIDLGDGSPYPPQIDPADAPALRRWLAKNITVTCGTGLHEGCPAVCALDSKVVEPRPCLCHCHTPYEPSQIARTSDRGRSDG